MRYDVLIVGSGAAGSVLAARLSEDASRTVCVLEAGPDFASVDELPEYVRLAGTGGPRTRPANMDWGYTAHSSSFQTELEVPRGRVIGGSSSVNGVVFFRALREDLNGWVAAGNPDWSFEACLPAFRRLENDRNFGQLAYHGAEGPVPVSRTPEASWTSISKAFHEACRALGYPDCPDMNAPDAYGVGPIPTNFFASLRHGTAVGYLLPARSRKNLTILGESHATRVLLEGKRAVAVEASVNGQAERIEAGEIVLAAGAIASPQLLMLSGIGPASHLSSVGVPVLLDLPGVGQGMRDHPALYTIWEGRQPAQPASGLSFEVGLRATAPDSDDVLDMQVNCLCTFGPRGDVPPRYAITNSIMHALSAGEVRLWTTDPAAPPLIDFCHLQDPSDMRRLRSILRTAVRIGQHEAFDSVRVARQQPVDAVVDSDEALNEWMQRTLVTGHHASCTCRMGPESDPRAVVDQEGRVRGLEALRVVDASIMPDCPRANTNATTIMLAEKISLSF
ncbi:MAG TPA: GMC family oxidoreductase N-terminal domain-containing protein [Chloroflexota bacterium]|jgi:choline dehydrogenase|nr:GMC family oxidoreductase N-terminal domain-containing protein [Chloroflexota bacterium]